MRLFTSTCCKIFKKLKKYGNATYLYFILGSWDSLCIVVHMNVPTCNNKNLVSLIYVNAINYCFNVMCHRVTLLDCSCSNF